jgi:hypothetical protein
VFVVRNTVLNALVTSRVDGETKVLVVVRRPETNQRHPGVVSLPTMRIPDGLGTGLDVLAELPPSADPVIKMVDGPPTAFGRAGAGKVMTSFLAEALLSRKLDAAPLLERGQLRGYCSLRGVATADVDDPGGTEDTEPTLMFTLLLEVTHGASLLPTYSASYTHIKWVEPALLRQAFKTRDGQLLFPTANPLDVCIRGLCIRAGVELLTTHDDIAALDPEARSTYA